MLNIVSVVPLSLALGHQVDRTVESSPCPKCRVSHVYGLIATLFIYTFNTPPLRKRSSCGSRGSRLSGDRLWSYYQSSLSLECPQSVCAAVTVTSEITR